MLLRIRRKSVPSPLLSLYNLSVSLFLGDVQEVVLPTHCWRTLMEVLIITDNLKPTVKMVDSTALCFGIFDDNYPFWERSQMTSSS